MPSKKFTGCNLNGDPIVIAWPIPDWGLSGATTIIFPRSFTASTRLSIPGAETPSSLVIRITGFSLSDLTDAFFGFFFGADFPLRRIGFVFAIIYSSKSAEYFSNAFFQLLKKKEDKT